MYGTDIKAIRDAFRISARDLAGLLGVSPQTVYRWEEQPDRSLKIEPAHRRYLAIMLNLIHRMSTLPKAQAVLIDFGQQLARILAGEGSVAAVFRLLEVYYERDVPNEYGRDGNVPVMEGDGEIEYRFEDRSKAPPILFESKTPCSVTLSVQNFGGTAQFASVGTTQRYEVPPGQTRVLHFVGTTRIVIFAFAGEANPAGSVRVISVLAG